MHDAQYAVREFMIAVDQPAPLQPRALDNARLELRLRLILEEFDELFHASGPLGEEYMEDWLLRADGTLLRVPQFAEAPKLDRVKQIDALCDLLYVTYGMAVEMGIDLEPFFDAVHASNMQKVGGPVSPEGKHLKPKGWQPPDIAGLYERIYKEKP